MNTAATEKSIKHLSLPLPLPTLEQDASIPFIAFDNYRFHYRAYGQEHADVILVLHGGPGGDFRYLLALEELADQYQVIFYDQRGSGLSPRTAAGELHLEQYLKDLDAFVSKFGQKRSVSLLGHSWGSHLALQYIARYPHKIHKLILAEPFIPFLSNNFKIVLHNLQYGIIGKAIKAKKESRTLFPSDKYFRDDYFFAYILQKSNPGYNCPGKELPALFWRSSYQSFLGLSFSLRTKLAEKKLREVRFPEQNMLMLAGECNALLDEEYHKKIQRRLRYPEIITIPEAGHYLFTDNPAYCLKVIREFMTAPASF